MTPEAPQNPPGWSRDALLSLLPEALRIIFAESLRAALRVVVVVGAIVGVGYALGRLRSVLAVLLVAAVFAYIMRPLAVWMARRPGIRSFHDAVGNVLIAPWRMVRKQAGAVHLSTYAHRVLTTFYVLVLLLVGCFYAGRWSINPFVQELRAAAQNWGTGNDGDLRLKTTRTAREISHWYETHVSQEIRNRIEAQLKQQQARQTIPERVANWAAGLASQIGPISHYVVEIVLFPVLAFYFALDSRRIKHDFVGLLPKKRRRAVMRIIQDFNGIMYSFVVGQAILCVIAGVVVGTGLAVLHVKYPLTLGLLAGITRAIPIIGPIVGGIPIIGLVLATKGFGVALLVLGFFTFLHFAESKFLMPYLIGDRMNLHPVVIIIVLLIGEEFGGLLGMFFAAPIAALVRVLLRRYWLRMPLEFGRTQTRH